jgi:predicted Zn-dependent protease
VRGRLIAAALLASLLPALAPALAPAQQGDLEARYLAGAAAFRAGRPHEALGLLQSVVAERPDFRDAQLLLGQSCLVVGRERQAKQQFEQILVRQPDNGQVAFLLGFSLYRASRWVEAVAALDRAHTLARANPYPRLYRGLSRLKLGDPEAARDDIQAALRLAPDDDAVQAAAAELELADGRFRAAALRLRPLVERTGDVEQSILLARALLEDGEAADAVAVLAPIEARRSDLLYVRAQALLRSGERERGRQELARFRERKRLEERLRLLEATVSTDPGDTDARLELTGLLLDEGQGGAAGLHLAALYRLLPNDSRVAALARRLDKLPP